MDKRKKLFEETQQTTVVLRDNGHRQLNDHRVSRDSASIDDIPMMQPDLPIDIAGLLHKKGRRFKTWKQRYFEIQGTNMYYFKDEKGKTMRDCLGYIDLTKLYFVGKSTAASFGAPFELQTMGRVHSLAARNEKDMEAWINVIKSKMQREAKARAKRGSRSDINAVYDRRQHRATIKLNRGERQAASSEAAARMSRIKTPSITEAEKPPAATENESLKSSQSFPEFSVHKINTPLVPSPSDHQISTKGDQQLPPVEKPVDLPPQPYNDVFPALDNLPSPDDIGKQQFVHNNNGEISTQDLPPTINEVLPALDNLPSPDDIGKQQFVYNNGGGPQVPTQLDLPPPIIEDEVFPSLDNLPSPDDIGLKTTNENLPTSPVDVILPPPLDADAHLPLPSSLLDIHSPLPSMDSPSLPIFNNNSNKTSTKAFNMLEDLPSPDEIGLPSFPSPPQSFSSDSPVIQELRDELVYRDDSYWKIPYDSSLLPPMAEPWREQNNAIDQLRSFLDVCI